MSNPNSIKGKGFESRPNDINKSGRPVGSKNRSTILKKWLKCKIKAKIPGTQKEKQVSLEDAVILALIKKASRGDVLAIREIQDTLHGKMTEKIQSTQNIIISPMSDEEAAEISKAMNDAKED